MLVPVACLRCLRSFQAAMKRLRHVDVTMTLTSSGVVIRGLPDGGLSFLLPGCRKPVCRRQIVCSLHPWLSSTSASRVPASRRQNAAFLFVDSLDCDLSLITLNFLWIIAIGTTLFQYRTIYEKMTLPVYRSTCTSCILKFG